MTKLEILDLAVNVITKIENLEAQADLDELWINNNQLSDWADLEYVGKTLTKLKGIYLASNPLWQRGDEFVIKVKTAIPQIKEVEGMPTNRPKYFIKPQANSIIKQGINPKAQAILADILGEQSAKDYAEDFNKNLENKNNENQ